MASSTYLTLTNQLLRRLNEVEIAQADFLVTRGVQSLAKDAVQAAIRKINHDKTDWPFNAAQGTQLLVLGQEEYNWPDDYSFADWESFYLQEDSVIGIKNTQLTRITREEWYSQYRPEDYDAGATGNGVPRYVFQTTGGYGVSYSPDKAYTLKFRYYRLPTTLTVHADTPAIPEQYNEVIIQCALYYMYMFRDNSEQAQIALEVYKNYLKEMSNVLIHKYDKVESTMIAWRR